MHVRDDLFALPELAAVPALGRRGLFVFMGLLCRVSRASIYLVGFDFEYRVAKEVRLLGVRRGRRRDARRFLPPEDFQQTLQPELARRRRRRLYGRYPRIDDGHREAAA